MHQPLRKMEKVEMHHDEQKPEGPFKEMHTEDHRGKGVDKINNPNKNKPSAINRKEFNKKRREYWEKEYFKEKLPPSKFAPKPLG
jgi:hypothetical protein